MKPILFNTEMVRAILDGRKTVTRRVVKPRYRPGEAGFQIVTNAHTGEYVRVEMIDEYDAETRCLAEPYKVGDILYVRESWMRGCMGGYVYRAGHENAERLAELHQWKPSIHMPKEAARIFLRVTDVRVERLREISRNDVFREGSGCGMRLGPEDAAACGNGGLCDCKDYQMEFSELWDSTIKPKDLPLYGWEANPWVWVIEFERISKEETA